MVGKTQFWRFIATRAPATVVMEACGSAHFWGRHAEASGHRVLLLSPHVVRPYVTRNKTDRADSKGLLEAVCNEASVNSGELLGELAAEQNFGHLAQTLYARRPPPVVQHAIALW
jgi:hypothetical protein